jgi:hypothetical protein
VKVAAFTVRADERQSARWKQCAIADGHGSVGAWLETVADAYIRTRARQGLPMPLGWHHGHFRVLLVDGQEVEVLGMLSPPWGEYVGTQEGPDSRNRHWTLVHIPSRRIVATLRHARAVKALAAELTPALLREDRELAAGVVARHEREGT